MSDSTFENAKTRLEKHLRILISQPIREFQEDYEVKITEITVELTEDMPIDFPREMNIRQIKQMKLTIER